MADESTSTPYSTTTKFVETNMPSWLNSYDAARLAAYKFYDDLYRNDPADYKLVLRGSEEMPIYIPTAKKIVNTACRYIGRNLGFTVSNLEGTALTDAITAIGDLFAREKVVVQFNAAKKQAVKLGDGCLFISADPLKPQGSRLKIVAIDPATYFPISDEADPDRIVGCDIVERIVGDEDKITIKRQRYMKYSHPQHSQYNPESPNPEAPIEYEVLTFEEQDWEDEDKRTVVQTVVPQTPLEDGITQLPVYHLKMGDEVGDPFGVSILQGLERIILGINQTATDEDVAVAMAGLGMYVADSTPVDEEGKETDWIIGPNRVVEVATGGTFTRVSGITSLEPSQGHMDWLEDQMHETIGISDVALGQVDTTVAESGIALQLRMGPLLDMAGDQNVILKATMDQFFHDLVIWMQVYEQINLGEAVVTSSFDSGVPANKKEDSDRLQDLFVNGIISKAFYRAELEKLYGYKFPEDMDVQIATEQALANSYFDTGSGDGTFDGTTDTGDNADLTA